MIVKPRIRGFICTTAHPDGCRAHVAEQIAHVTAQGAVPAGVKRALVVGCSGGYGLASRIVAAFGCGADTLGVSFEKHPQTARRPRPAGTTTSPSRTRPTRPAAMRARWMVMRSRTR